MVMKSAMHKNLLRTIKHSLGRYIAIMAIIALGSGIFVGLLTSKYDMLETGRQYLDTQNMFDLRLLSSYGWTEEERQSILNIQGVSDAEGGFTQDVLGKLELRDKEDVYQIFSMPQNMNTLRLVGGRLPAAEDECVIDDRFAGDEMLGSKFVLSSNNEEDVLDTYRNREFTIVGYVRSPLFMDMTRGNSSLGDGSIASFIYVPRQALDTDIYTDIYITLDQKDQAYTDAYDDRMEQEADRLEPLVLHAAHHRLLEIKKDAEKEYAEGLQEYNDGVREVEDAEKKLQEAYQKIVDGRLEISQNEKKLQDGRKALEDGQRQLNDAKKKLDDSRKTLDKTEKDTYAQLDAAQKELKDQQKKLQGQEKQIREGLESLEKALGEIDAGITQLEGVIQQMGGVGTEAYEKKLAELKTQRAALAAQQKELQKSLSAVVQGLSQVKAGLSQVAAKRAEAKKSFEAARAELKKGYAQVEANQKTLDSQRRELEKGEQALRDARKELEKGTSEFEKERVDAEKKIADAREDLAKAQRELAKARNDIDGMEDPKVYVLGRNTNMGYVALLSNANIVEGVSRVFPAFFLLVASLVCITTMTRMVEEERTQIGTLKALGYSNGSIISKYLIYAGSAAVLGCGLGVFAGSIVFPKVIWMAYQIMMSLEPELLIRFDISLCLIVVLSYTAVILLVTWNTCRRSLREVPAELIRPKAPAAGKKILLEYIPLWKRVSFLNKVTLRNIFRYHQRLLMMLVGIGGCTALLVTGFGIGDSIKDIVDYQYREVTRYDMQIQFGEGQTERQQKEFAKFAGPMAQNVEFAYQASVDLQKDGHVRSLYLIGADEGISNIFDLHSGKESLQAPEAGKALLSVGVAEAMGIHVGDTISVRAKDLQDLTVEISGIFDNNIDNYLITSPATLEQQWSRAPEPQLVFLQAAEGQDVHNVGAKVSGFQDVTAVMISQDLADQVDSMLDAMDMIVVTVVICAGILAVIVLYNLTNINITERLREIATIKVLGFRAHETAAYVFKENLLLSAMGCVLGLGFGKLLLDFVMSQIKIDIIWFQSRIAGVSILLAILITMLMACLVDFILYFRLDKINMAEALKSVE